jgi:hypothetical protein
MKRPILALTPEGTVRDIISETGMGLCIPPENVEEIKYALKYLPKIIINPNSDIEKYSAMECVWDLALIIKELVNKKEDVKNNQRLRGET